MVLSRRMPLSLYPCAKTENILCVKQLFHAEYVTEVEKTETQRGEMAGAAN